MAGGDVGAGETDENVQELPDGEGDLQPAARLPPGPGLQAHPSAGLQCAQGGGKETRRTDTVQANTTNILKKQKQNKKKI